MRRVCQRVLQTRCTHGAQPFHAGRALFAALHPRTLSTSNPRRKDDDAPVVRWYEQTSKSPGSIRRVEDDFEDIEKEAQGLFDIDREFDELGLTAGQEIGKSKGGFFGNQKRSLQPVEEGEIVDMQSLDMHYRMPQLVKRHVQRFNAALQRSAASPQDLKSRRDLWAIFLRCSATINGFQEQITPEAWKVLWRSQAAQPFLQEQAAHLIKLAETMQTLGIPLTRNQKLLLIKAFEADGQEDAALVQWQSLRVELETDSDLRHEYAALGVILHCASGQPQLAQDIAFTTIGRDKRNLSANRLLIPVITAWAKQGSEEDLKKAWVLYLLVRRTLGAAQSEKDAISAEDFDQIYLGFVEAGRKDLAVLVFKDLIVADQQSEHDSLRIARGYGQVLEDLHEHAKLPEQVDQISLDILSKLPKRFENKYFYASWMKRLIGMGRVDAAVSVVELMYERGVRPDAKHVNGIVGAWLRGGDTEHQQKACDIAWSMVEQRLEYVAQRRHKDSSPVDELEASIERIRIPAHLKRPVPPATTETLCLLLLYYSLRRVPEDMERVQAMLIEAELPPNSYFMNHLMYYYCNSGKWIETWDFYNKMSRQVRPDLTTFACLWDCAHGLTRRYEQMDRFPAPRRLFSTMMDWFSQLPPKARREAQESFKVEMYDRIVQTFMQFKDTKGMLVALYAMRDSFGHLPSDATIRAVTVQIAQMSEPRQSGHPIGRSRLRRKKAASFDLNKNIDKTGKALQMILENRSTELEHLGVKMDQLGEQERGEESLYVVAELLKAANRTAIAVDAEADESFALSEEIDQIAWQMGAGPFRMAAPVYDK